MFFCLCMLKTKWSPEKNNLHIINYVATHAFILFFEFYFIIHQVLINYLFYTY